MRRQWSLSAERGSRRDFRTGLTLARWIDHGRSISVACSRGTEFVQKHPVATKRALRAILKAADLCARETERVARFIVDKGFTPTYDHALQTIIDMCINNRHRIHKKAGNSEAVIKDRRSSGRFCAFLVIRPSAAMSSSRLSGRPLASVALKWVQTNSSGFRSGA